MEAGEEGALLFLIPAFDQDQELFGACPRSLVQEFARLLASLSRGVPEIVQGGRIGLRQLLELVINGGISLGQRCQGVDAQQQFAGFFLRDIQDFDLDFQVGIEFTAQVAIDQFQPAIGQFVSQQTASKANFFVKSLEGRPLALWMEPAIEFVRHQLPGPKAAMAFDAMANVHGRRPFANSG